MSKLWSNVTCSCWGLGCGLEFLVFGTDAAAENATWIREHIDNAKHNEHRKNDDYDANPPISGCAVTRSPLLLRPAQK